MFALTNEPSALSDWKNMFSYIYLGLFPMASGRDRNTAQVTVLEPPL
jgi:hypothetical protein